MRKINANIKKSKLSIKLLVPLIVSVVIGIIGVIGISLSICGKGISDLSGQYSCTVAEDYARRIENQLSITLNTAKTLSTDIRTVMQIPGIKRDDILKMVSSVLSNHDELVGIGVGFEPNAFDGKDASNIGRKDSDASGRFVPYTFRDGSKVDYTTLVGYDATGPDSSWYTVPKSTNKTYVTSPYWYEVGSEKHLILTCVAPILDNNGKFIGMVGFDTIVSSLSSVLDGAKIYDTGYLTMVSNDGIIAYHPSEEVTSKSIYDVMPKALCDLADNVYRTVEHATQVSSSITTGQKILNILEPIEAGESGGCWILATSVPVSEINRTITTSITSAILLGIIVLILIIFLLLKIIHKIVLAPISMLSIAAEQLSCGDLALHINHNSNDELGNWLRISRVPGIPFHCM